MTTRKELKRSGHHEMRKSDWGKQASRHITTCLACGKRCFRSRADAKRAIRQLKSFGVVVTRAYQCGQYWHLTSQDTETTTRHREADS